MPTNADIFPEPYTHLLFVEGEDDKAFFLNLCTKHLRMKHVYIKTYEGVTKIGTFVAALMDSPRYELLHHLAIVMDADDNPKGALNRIQTAIRNANQRVKQGNPDARLLPEPKKNIKPVAQDGVTVSALILPSGNENGMLETVILQAQAETSEMTCVDAFIKCLADQGLEPIPQRIDKERFLTFLAAKNMCDSQSNHDTNLYHIYDRLWWNWDHPAFEPIRTFLRQLQLKE